MREYAYFGHVQIIFCTDLVPEMSVAGGDVIGGDMSDALSRLGFLEILTSILRRIILLWRNNDANVSGGPVLQHGRPPDERLATDVAKVGRRLAPVPPHVDL